MGKVVKGGNANYGRHPEARHVHPIPNVPHLRVACPAGELVLMLLQTKPDYITAVSTDRSLLLSHLAPEPSHFTLPDASNVALPAEAHSLTQPPYATPAMSMVPAVSTAQPNPVTPATSRPFVPPGPESTALGPSPK